MLNLNKACVQRGKYSGHQPKQGEPISLYLQVMSCTDHLGAEKLAEVLSQVGGRMIPMDALLNLYSIRRPCGGVMYRDMFPLESSIGYLLSSQELYRSAFPVAAGTLHWAQG